MKIIGFQKGTDVIMIEFDEQISFFSGVKSSKWLFDEQKFIELIVGYLIYENK